MTKKILSLIGLFLIMVDQWTKFWVVNHIELGESRGFLPPLFNLTYLRNYGAAFSMLQHQQGLFALVTVAFLAVAGYYFWTSKSKLVLYPLILIIAGGIGNFIDRLRLGYVVDMVDLAFMDFAIFNVADAYLTVGVSLMLLLTIFEKEEN